MRDNYGAAALCLLVGAISRDEYKRRCEAIRRAGEDDVVASIDDPAARAALRRVFARRRAP